MWRVKDDGKRETCSICSGNTIVEVVVGKGTDKKVYSEKEAALDYAMSDAEFIDKFMRNTRKSLNEYNAKEMIAIIQSLENLDDITELFRLATIK